MRDSWTSWGLKSSTNKMDSCSCEMLASVVDIRRQFSSWQNEFEPVGQRPFLFLRRCGKCGQLWQFDLIDKY